MKKAVLLDVSAIMYRAFYAHMNFRTKGEPTGAIFGFTNTLLAVIDEFKPDYIGAAFDVKRSTLKRSEKYDGYKAERKPMPDDLRAQVPRIEEVLDAFGVEKYKVDGHEADDVLGTLAKKLSAEGIEVYIITGDKDLSQVLDENINIALLGKGEGKSRFKVLSTEEDVKEQLGVNPKDIPDLFGLIGDTSDGIPGVRKVGVKKAVPMLEKYGNLEGIYENIDKLVEIPGVGKGLVKNIEEDKEIAFLSRDLATIDTDVPLNYHMESMEHGIDNDKLHELFKVLEFRVLIKKLGLKEAAVKEEVKVESTSPQMNLFAMGGAGTEAPKVSEEAEDGTLRLVEDLASFEAMKKKAKAEGRAAVLMGDAGFAVSLKKADYYIPLYHDYLGAKNVENTLMKDFLKEDIEIISYRLKEVIKSGYQVKNIYLDTLIAYYLITAHTKEEIDQLIYNETGEEPESYKDAFGKEAPGKVETIKLGEFLVKRSRFLYDMADEMMERMTEEGVREVYDTIEMPLMPILAGMEMTGIAIDPAYFEKFGIELKEKIEKLQKSIYDLAEEEFNLNSPKQLGEILFMKLNIDTTGVKKTKTGYSTNVDVLEYLRDRGEKIAEYILEYRKLAKLSSTYVEALPKLVDRENRLHTTFNQTGTATGRLSSSNPNLQNIPVKTDEGIRIRQGFVARDGYSILALDYSQIELRVLAEISKDENLVDAYKHGLDLHALTAKRIFDLEDGEEVTREQRTMAKIVNFSIIYGKTAFGLAKELSIPQPDAKEYIARYFAQYPKVKELEERIIAEAEEKGYVRTLFGRKRSVEGITAKNRNIKSQAERMAVNTVIQGTAADILKKVMIRVAEVIEGKEDITLNLQVHDELIFEVRDEMVDKYAKLIKEVMEESITFDDIKLEANVAFGKNWAEAK